MKYSFASQCTLAHSLGPFRMHARSVAFLIVAFQINARRQESLRVKGKKYTQER